MKKKNKTKQNKNSSYSRISSNGYLATKATFLFWRAKSRGDWGEASPNKEARRGTMGREKEGNKPFLSFHSPNRPPDFLGIPRRKGGGGGSGSASGRSRPLGRPAQGYLPNSAVSCFLPDFDPGRKQDSNQFHVFLFFVFMI